MRVKITCILAALLIAGFFTLHAEPRVALVIGNGAYRYTTTLKNPINDAVDMAAALRAAGFEVILKTDAGLDAMHTAVREFGNRLKENRGTGLFFYSGHGAQVKGKNYLLPVDQDIREADEVAYKALDAEAVLAKMESAGNQLNLVFLDACRNNPFPGSSKSADKGLAAMRVELPESVIVYAAEPGKTADEGEGSRNSPFTRSLLANMKSPNTDILIVMKKVKAEVGQATGGRQSPRVDQNLSRDFSFYTGGTQGQQGSGTGTLTVEKSYGAIRVEVKETAKVYVDGVYKGEVPGGNAASITGVESGSRSVRLSYVDGKTEEKTVPVTANGTAYATFSYQKPVPQDESMVYVAGGTFSMGSNSGYDWVRPVHTVTVSGFSMAIHEVTQKEFRDLMGFNPSYFKGDSLPVERVTWYDAVAFCNAKSRKEGLKEAYTVSGITRNSDGNITTADVSAAWSASGYRLPTEAEWEWAARGGKSSRGYHYSGSNSIASISWYLDNSNYKTQPVRTLAANELGIYDLSGNVWEWCWDWYGNYSSGSQTDPKGPSAGVSRVFRGGSWYDGADTSLVSNRSNFEPDKANSCIGFRPVRSN